VNEHGRLHDVVLGAAQRAPRKLGLYAGIAAAVLHVGGAAVAVALSGTSEPKRVRPSAPIVVFEHVVDLVPPVVAPPPEPAAPEPPAPVAVTPPPPRPKAKAVEQAKVPTPVAPVPPPEAPAPPPVEPPSEPPPAAQAAQVVAQEPSAQAAPTSFNIATGAGQAYAGGTTSARGTGTQANHTGQVGVGNGTGLGRARPAQLRTRNPPCGWPPEAEDLDIEEAFVLVQASVLADGSLSNVKVVSDPGYGFGKRAAACARTKMKFEPALDASGAPVPGATPPLRIRFVRED
jgi:periplasmic protein TonB